MTPTPGAQRPLKIVVPLLLAVAVALAGAAAIFGGGGEARQVTIPAGTTLIASLEHSVSTENGEVGDGIVLHTTEPVTLGDDVIPAGMTIRGEVTHVKGGGRIAGAPELTLRFTELEVNGETHGLSADPFRIRGRSDAGESAKEIGGGAVAGGIVGGVLGGGKGALKGAAAGAVIGTGVAVATDGDDLTLPAGQTLRVRVAGPVEVTYVPEHGEHERS